MPGSAKATKMKFPVVADYVMPTELRINCKEFKNFKECQVGDKVSFSGKGKVTQVNASEGTHSVCIEMEKMKENEDA